MSRKTWLASLGAIESGKSYTIDKVDQLYVQSNGWINELVDKGLHISSDFQPTQKATDMIEDKIALLRSKLGLGTTNRDAELDKLSQKVDTLIEVVAKLAQQKAAESKTAEKKAPAAKKNTTRKTTASKTATKTAAKESTKPASKLTTAKKPAAAKSTGTSKTPAKPRTRKPASTAKKTD